MSGSYRDIKAWQKAIELVVEVYSSTRSFPREETYGLANQLRRASVSIPSNIAEGKDAPTRSFFSFYTMPADQSSRSRPNLPSPEGWLR
jgi:four helix bundle protein